MKLSISNIAWAGDADLTVYELMKKYGYCGLEIAPTRIFPDSPYEKLEAARQWKKEINSKYGFLISSMQSIWYGRTEKIFGSDKERTILLEYTKKAIDFASAIDCNNLVFGCPRNRNLPENGDVDIAIRFFRELGDYAHAHNTIIGLEANPPIYNTNFITDTDAALDLICQVDSPGFLLNLDIGTMIENGESIENLIGKVRLINHVHISEPGLKLIVKRNFHQELCLILNEEGYDKYVSIEMGRQDDINKIEKVMEYLVEILK